MTASNLFSAIADPSRREILDFLAVKPRSAGEIVSHFPQLTQPGVSRHLRVLREAQLVSVTVRAQQRIYTIRPQGLLMFHDWVKRYLENWMDELDAPEDGPQSGKVTRHRAAKRQ
jgi:DNA-binding transcriptional ArsR family regulator